MQSSPDPNRDRAKAKPSGEKEVGSTLFRMGLGYARLGVPTNRSAWEGADPARQRRASLIIGLVFAGYLVGIGAGVLVGDLWAPGGDRGGRMLLGGLIGLVAVFSFAPLAIGLVVALRWLATRPRKGQ
jgi:hypothetical protein